jgi:S-adenosylhomocysteine hydrolase
MSRSARLKISSLGLAIDEMSEEQKTYLCSWDIGT